MRFTVFILFALLGLTGCNHVTIKPNTLEPNSIIYADRGGYSMRRAVKDVLEQHGHKVVVGIAVDGATKSDDTADIEYDTYKVPKDAQYVIKVREREEAFRTTWCAFNGFWWWRYNVSIANQRTGEEILAWFGHGCANSATRIFDNLLDQLEIQENTPTDK